MSGSYVTSKATLKCSFGDKTSKLTVYPDRTVFLTEKPMANISDHSMYNIAPFGKCHTTRYPLTGSATAANHGHLMPMPCAPEVHSLWENGNDTYIVQNFPALLTCSSCRCIYGGVITIVTDGQIPNEYEQVKTLQQEVIDETSESQYGAGLDVIDFIPVVGSIRDIGEGLASGSMGMVALGTVFLVADVVGVIGSVFSGGAATVGVTAVKSSIKVGAKVAAKTVAKESTQQAVKQGEKKLLEITAKTATEQTAKQTGKDFLELTARGATEGTTKLSIEAAEELGEEAFKELSVNFFKPNIFEVETKIAETGAKEVTKKKLLEITAKTATEQTTKQTGKDFLELTARGATEGTTKLSVEAVEELGEEAFKFFKPNIFEFETKIAETGAKEVTKSPVAICQVAETLKPLEGFSKGVLETGMKQIDDIAKVGREYLSVCGDVIKKEVDNLVRDFKRCFPQIKQWKKNKDELKKENKKLNELKRIINQTYNN